MMRYKNKKNGELYDVENNFVVNCTNANDGQIMVLYHSVKNPHGKFIRERSEFYEKFTEQKE